MPLYDINELRQRKVGNPERIEQIRKELSQDLTDLRTVYPQAKLKFDCLDKEDGKTYISIGYVIIENEGVNIMPQNTYRGNVIFEIYTEDLQNIDYNTVKSAREELTRPSPITKFTVYKVNQWVEYCTQWYKNLKEMSLENTIKKDLILKKIFAEPDVEMIDKNRGFISRNYLEYSFNIMSTYVWERIYLSIPPEETNLETFIKLADNKIELPHDAIKTGK